LALGLGAMIRILEPWPIKFVLDQVLLDESSEGAFGLDPATLLTVCALAVVVLALFRAVADYWSKIGFALAGNRVLTRVRTDLYRHLQRLSLPFHDNARAGDLTVRVIGDVGLVREVAVTALLPMLANGVVLLAMAIVMFWLDARLTLIAALTLPFLLVRAGSLNGRIHEVSRQQRRREGALAATAAESVTSIRTVRALSLESRFESQFDHHAAKDLREGVRGKRLSAHLERSVDVAVAASTALALWFGARSVLLGALTPGELVVFLAYLKRAFRPIRDVAKYSGRLAKASAASDRIFDILDRVPEVRDLPGARPLTATEGRLSFEGVTVRVGEARLLTGVELEIAPRSLVALVGPSGAGKTTLTQLVPRLLDPHGGCVRIDGSDLRDYTLDSLRSHIGVVLQEGALFAGSIYENIAIGSPGSDDDDVFGAARLAQAASFIEALPAGFDTQIGERGTRLSGGERQRIALARALIRDPAVLLLDEPTTGLDAINRRAFSRAIHRSAKDRTVLLVTHDMELAATADLVVALDKGRLAEVGSPDDLQVRGGLFARLRNDQRGIHARPA